MAISWQKVETGNRRRVGWKQSARKRMSKQVRLNGPVLTRETNKPEKLIK